MSSQDQIRVGLIGAGYMGKCHAIAIGAVAHIYPELPSLRPVSLCDPNEQLLKDMSRTGVFERYETDWRELVGAGDIDLLIIAAPNSFHREMSVAALGQGINVLCEKPMAITLEDAEAMAAAADNTSAQAILGYSYLRNPAIKHIKSIIDSGAIGSVISFRGIFAEDYQADESNPHSWRCLKDQAGLGALGDLGCHLISISHYLIGDIERLCGLTHIAFEERPLADDPTKAGTVTNEDAAYALVRFQSGVPGVIEASRSAWGAKNRLEFEIQGSKGAIRFNQERMNEIELYSAADKSSQHGFKTIMTGPEHPPYGRFVPSPGHQIGFVDLKTIEIGEFVGQLSGGESTGPNFKQGLAIERAIHAVSESARTHDWVQL